MSTASTPTPDDGEGLPRPAWLLSDYRRSIVATWIVTGVLVLGSVVSLMVVVRLGSPQTFDARQWSWIWMFGGWALITASHALFVWLAFRRLTGDQLERAVLYSGRQRRLSRMRRWLMAGGEGASLAIQMAMLALFGVAVLLFSGSLRRSPWVLAAAGALVVAAWIDCLVTYALEYARRDHIEPLVLYPEGDQVVRSWSDYVYLAASVQTTFGVTDLVLANRRARQIVTRHALLAFGFNTVIIAMMVSLTLSS